MIFSAIPAPWIAALHRYDSTAVNAENAPVRRWAPPKDQRGTLFWVQGWAPPGGAGDPEYQKDRSAQRIEMYMPPVLIDIDGNEIDDPGPVDVIDLPDVNSLRGVRPGRAGLLQALAQNRIEWETFEVQGWPRDYTKGFHLWQPGKVVDLERIG
ncbi:hypothetical protein [Mycobacteroides abscessus]|uniref:hypothetical protein n=1 Tax=Mycobacteroides abscessus TaxID=36809 RepID=UPI000929C27B|nr:hypothetical protein [Mycobacteroides abscessus]DAZ90346.1 TPA_asm: head-to-tail stopper [Mycobacterium phage prophiFSQJ01-1]SII41325.1 Uncharacterised protein [Mycobacteroides abscessus subsp. abscessus]SIK13849.1 Uncharacterised protein [Mycobacteroides abscessus subsp. abscessus]SIN25580.1 Uncharacterised protein [Mycobacteroides abscessus subsp. abscessus]SLI51331.1 Uncharacterised protein [Mycobacteroides abscessus subsp. abscessus]